MRKIISLALALLLVFSIAGCSKKGETPDNPQGSEADVISSLPAMFTNVREEDLYGVWKTEINIAPYIRERIDVHYPPYSLFLDALYSDIDCPTLPELDLSVMIPVYLWLEEDGTHILYVPGEEYEAAVHTCVENLATQASEDFYCFWEQYGVSRQEADELVREAGEDCSTADEYYTDEFTFNALSGAAFDLPSGVYEICLEDKSIIFHNYERLYYTGDEVLYGSDLQTVPFTLQSGRLTLKVGSAVGDLVFTKIPAEEMPNDTIYNDYHPEEP